MKYYLAGPMTGVPEYNFPLFTEVASRLRAQGAEIVSPHEIDHGETRETRGGLPYHTYMRAGLRRLLDCHGIILLPDWKNSVGTIAEFRVALACGMEYAQWDNILKIVIDVHDWEIADVR